MKLFFKTPVFGGFSKAKNLKESKKTPKNAFNILLFYYRVTSLVFF